MTVYEHMGYENREHYLKCLAEEHGIDLDTVTFCADMLGPSEDFDGLVTTLEDADMFFGE